ncbi:unnamed protein product [Allacma fusca]|uniref:CRAL-TRIO domain-containing protein n=1 Tax=Allacma fusca TaxID=39272 RepID=A0A8J2IYI1_9HEXA|nr:unnamed protein product [Allacma fusca]
MSATIFIYFGVLSLLGFLNSFAQIQPDEIPNELQFIVNGDLDTWEPPKDISKNYPYYLSGFDIENRPVWVLEFGKWDVPVLIARGEDWEEALSKHIDQWLWKMYNSTGLRGSPDALVKDVVAIIDMDGYNIRQINSAKAVAFVLRKMKTITIALQFAYGAYVVNANFFARNLLNLLRPIMGSEFEHLQIYGTNPSKYQPVLLKHIPRDQIPQWYGGLKDFKPIKVYG